MIRNIAIGFTVLVMPMMAWAQTDDVQVKHVNYTLDDLVNARKRAELDVKLERASRAVCLIERPGSRIATVNTTCQLAALSGARGQVDRAMAALGSRIETASMASGIVGIERL